MSTTRGPASPPWGLSEPCRNSNEPTCCKQRPKTRSEMLRSRQEQAVSFARTQLEKRSVSNMPLEISDADGWWKVAEGYRENALEDIASSPRYQLYVRRKSRTRVAEDPYGTHQVRLRGPTKAWAEKISSADPPPADAEAYLKPKRTAKQFSKQFFEWKARLTSHGDLDERGKNKKVTLDECAPPYSSLCSSFTGCSIDPRNNIRSTSQAKAALRAAPPHPGERPSAAEVATRAQERKRTMWEAILAATGKTSHGKHDLCHGSVRSDGCGGGSNANGHRSNRSRSRDSSRTRSSLASFSRSADAADVQTCRQVEMRPPSAPPESNRRRYSRLCGQG